MTGSHLVSALLLALAALAVMIAPRRAGRDRISKVWSRLATTDQPGLSGWSHTAYLQGPSAELPSATPVPVRSSSPRVGATVRARLAGVAVGGGVALALGGWSGLVTGALAGLGCHYALRRAATGAIRRQVRRAAADLPYGADLLAAALRAGVSPAAAAGTVGTALPGPLGDRLSLVGRALNLGASASEAWAHLGSVPGAGRIADAAVRSEHSGAALAGALDRLAVELRAARLAEADAAARRAGVLIVLPLGLCFLPAFVLAGLVPVIVAVLGDVLSL